METTLKQVDGKTQAVNFYSPNKRFKLGYWFYKIKRDKQSKVVKDEQDKPILIEQLNKETGNRIVKYAQFDNHYYKTLDEDKVWSIRKFADYLKDEQKETPRFREIDDIDLLKAQVPDEVPIEISPGIYKKVNKEALAKAYLDSIKQGQETLPPPEGESVKVIHGTITSKTE